MRLSKPSIITKIGVFIRFQHAIEESPVLISSLSLPLLPDPQLLWTSFSSTNFFGGGEPGIAPDYLHYKPKATSNSIINLTTCFKSVVSLNFMALRLMATLKQAGFWVRIKEPSNSLFSERRQEIGIWM